PAAVYQGFDFGSTGSPVAAGATGVTGSTLYNPTLGYGWVNGVYDYDRGAALVPAGVSPVALYQDGAWGFLSPGVFRVTVAPGAAVPAGRPTARPRATGGRPGCTTWNATRRHFRGRSPRPRSSSTATGPGGSGRASSRWPSRRAPRTSTASGPTSGTRTRPRR